MVHPNAVNSFLDCVEVTYFLISNFGCDAAATHSIVYLQDEEESFAGALLYAALPRIPSVPVLVIPATG